MAPLRRPRRKQLSVVKPLVRAPFAFLLPSARVGGLWPPLLGRPGAPELRQKRKAPQPHHCVVALSGREGWVASCLTAEAKHSPLPQTL